MPKATKYRLFIRFTTFCLCLLSLLTITKTSWPQEEQKKTPLKEWQIKGVSAALRDQIFNVRVQAIYYLTELNSLNQIPKDDVKYIAVLLEDSDRDVREAAVGALGKLGELAKDYIPQIAARVEDSDRDVREAAVGTLGKLGELANDYIPQIVYRFEDSDLGVRRAAAQALAQLGELAKDYIPQIAARLENPNSDVRIAAMWALAQLGELAKDYIPQIAVRLEDSDLGVRMAALRALAQLGELAKDYIPQIAARLEDSESYVRREALQALAQLGELVKDYIPQIAARLENPNSVVRIAAMWALAQLGELAKDYIPQIAVRLEDSESYVREAAMLALAHLGELAKDYIPQIAVRLEDSESDVRRASLRALAKLGELAKDYIPQIAARLEDSESDVRREALQALVQLGELAKDYIPQIVVRLEDSDLNVGSAAVRALAQLGELAKDYIPQIAARLENPSWYVRSGAVLALAQLGELAKDYIPQIAVQLEDSHYNVKSEAMLALAQLGELAKDYIPQVAARLEDSDPNVRSDAVRALAQLGELAKDYIPQIAVRLDDSYSGARLDALRAVAQFGELAKDYIPQIAARLEDSESDVRSEAVKALRAIDKIFIKDFPLILTSIYTYPVEYVQVRFLAHVVGAGKEDIEVLLKWLGEPRKNIPLELSLDEARQTLQIFSVVWDSSADFRKLRLDLARQIAVVVSQRDISWTKDDLKLLRIHKKNLDSINSTHVNALKDAINAITPPWETVWNWINKNKLNQAIGILVPLYIFLVIVWLIFFWLRPLALLRINQALRPLDVQIKSIKLPLRFFLFVGFLNYHPRVLDAWVKKYIATCRDLFSENPTVQYRKIHISVPVELNKVTIPDLTAKNLHPTFARQIGRLLIWGEGGSGKTSLACQIAKWALAEDKDVRLCHHLMLPVLIEQELTSEGDQSAFINAVGKQLQDLADQANPIAEELLERLLRQRRILVIVDHLSEMSKHSRDQIQPEKKGFPANALIVTSRLEETLGGVIKTVIKPLRVAGNRLSSFMEAYLTQKGKRDLFDDPDFFDACRRLSEMVGDRDITLLLAKLYAEQLIATKEGVSDEKLPDNIPDLMLSYLNDLNRSITEDKIDDRLVHQSTKALAWLCLKNTYRPSAVRLEDALTALDPTGSDVHLDYLERRLRLIKTIPPAKDRLEFVLDPLAEYLAGLHFIEHRGNKPQSWRKFFRNADSKEGAPETIKGFLLAVRDCIIAKGEEAKVPNFVADELAKRGGLDIEAKKQAKKEQRIQRLINQLSFPEPNDRQHAAQALGQIGREAKAAVPPLIEALKDTDESVRTDAAQALWGIGSEAKAAVPALIEALKDKDEDKFVRGATAQALGEIGSEAKAAVPDLIEALKDEDEIVRGATAQALGQIGPEAKAAVPILIEAFKDKNEHKYVRGAAAYALGQIGSEAKAAVPDLIEVLKDKDESVRKDAAQALGQIGPEAKAAVPAFTEALKDEDEVVRGAAAYALGQIGPEAKAAVPALIGALKDEDEVVRGAAVYALGQIGSEAKAAVLALIEALKDGDWSVRSDAAEALEKINTPEAQKALEEYKKKTKKIL